MPMPAYFTIIDIPTRDARDAAWSLLSNGSTVSVRDNHGLCDIDVSIPLPSEAETVLRKAIRSAGYDAPCKHDNVGWYINGDIVEWGDGDGDLTAL
jgi:hypothetical protein